MLLQLLTLVSNCTRGMCNVNSHRPVTWTPQVENIGLDWFDEVYEVQTQVAKIWIAADQNYLINMMHAKFEKASWLDRNSTL